MDLLSSGHSHKMNTKIIITCASLALMLSACGGGKSILPEVQPPSNNAHTRLQRSISNEALEKDIKHMMLATYGKIAPLIMYSTTGAGTADTRANYSTTNTQETDVDEADRLKNDASYLYVASSKEPSIKIFSTQSGEAVLSSTTSITNDNSQAISGLYLAKNKLIALSGHNSYFWDQWFNPNHWTDRSTRLDFFTTQNGQLNKINKLNIDGQLISSRRIGNTLYLVTRHTPSLKGLIDYPSTEQEVSKNRELIKSASLADFLPNYTIDDENKGDILSAENCFTTSYAKSENQQASIINILTIDLNNTSEKPKGSCFIGAAEALYVSSKSLYLATTQYNYQTANNIAAYPPSITTDIHKFSLNETSVIYKGSAQLAGHLGWKQDAKSFRMGEYNDILRIITYTGNSVSSNPSPAKLFILKEDDNSASEKLKIIATLPNDNHPEPLGKTGEQIYATRFIGNKAYLVTFRATDPLYILDLSDPSDPVVAGELEVNGYSDYLHPINENLVLGIGKDAIAATAPDSGDNRGAWYQGVKLTLFDVSDPQNPYTRSQLLIGKRGTNTAVSYNHRAFTSLLRSNGDLNIAFPISVHANEMTSEGDTDITYHEWKYDGLFRYNINTYTGDLSERTPTIKAEKSSANKKQSSGWTNDRSAIIGDKIYYLHGDKIISSHW